MEHPNVTNQVGTDHLTLFEKMKECILRRLSKNLTLEELEVIEAQQQALFKKQSKCYNEA